MRTPAESAATPRRDRLRHFTGALRLQAIVIFALMMREIHTRYGRENLGFVWLIAEPFMFCMGVIGIWTVLHGRYEHGIPILGFVLTGYMPLTLWRHCVQRSVHCFRANASLLYHRQVRMLDLLVARIVLEVYGSIIAYAVIAFIFWATGFYELPEDWGLFYLGWAYMIAFSGGLGLVMGCVSEMAEWSEKLVGPFMYFLLPISGVFFMTDWLPDRYRELALYVPTVNAFEMIRGGQFGPSVRVHYEIGYTTAVSVALILLGLILCRQVHRHLVAE
jgi:capsular polysaccharide transport system permease protein